MNWFQKFFTNPNVHAIAAGLSPGFMMAFPQYAPAIAALGTVTGLVAAATPEHPVVVPQPAPLPPVVSVPPAAQGGSYHAVDYANLAAALVTQFATKPADVSAPSR